MTTDWTFIGQPSGRDSHRYFRHIRNRDLDRPAGWISICDMSGDDPDQTDDGVLYVNPGQVLEPIGEWAGEDDYFRLRCTDNIGEPASCTVTKTDAVWLSESGIVGGLVCGANTELRRACDRIAAKISPCTR